MNDAIVDSIKMILRGKNLSQRALAREISMAEATMSKTQHKARAISIDEVDTIAKSSRNSCSHAGQSHSPSMSRGFIPLGKREYKGV